MLCDNNIVSYIKFSITIVKVFTLYSKSIFRYNHSFLSEILRKMSLCCKSVYTVYVVKSSIVVMIVLFNSCDYSII